MGPGTDLVRRVAVGGDAVGAGDDGIDLTGSEQCRTGTVGEERGIESGIDQFPSGEPGSLEQGTGFAGEDLHRMAELGLGVDHAEGGATPGGCEAPGVAVGEDSVTISQFLGSETAHRVARGDVFGLDRPSLGERECSDLVDRCGGGRGGTNPIDGPREVHGGGPGGTDLLDETVDRGTGRLEVGGACFVEADDHAVGATDADGRRPTDSQPIDGVDHLIGVGQGEDVQRGRKHRLVDDLEGAVDPVDRRLE